MATALRICQAKRANQTQIPRGELVRQSFIESIRSEFSTAVRHQGDAELVSRQTTMAGLVRPITLTTVDRAPPQDGDHVGRKGYHGASPRQCPTAPIAAQDAFAFNQVFMFPWPIGNAIAGHSPTASCELSAKSVAPATGFKLKWAEKWIPTPLISLNLIGGAE